MHYPTAVPITILSFGKLFTDYDNVKILLDRDEIFKLGRDPEQLALVSGVADVSQDNFLLIYFPHFKVLK